MNHRLREVGEKAEAAMNMAKESAKETAQLKEQMDKDREMGNKKVEKSELNIFEEMNLREEKRKNVVIHGMPEPTGEDGKSRMDADKRKLDQIFTILEINIAVDSDVEFCRRIGEKAEKDRPLIVGFYSEWAKSVLLKNSKYLAETEMRNLSVVPDLTERQRKAEKDLIQEAERKNREELTEEDRSKNWVWRVVGKKGQKRLVKGYDAMRGGWSRGAARGAGAVTNGARGRVALLPALPPRGEWEPGAATRGTEGAGGRKRRQSGDGERVRKRGTGRGRPPLRGRGTNQSIRQPMGQTEDQSDSPTASQPTSQPTSQMINTEEEEMEIRERSSRREEEEEEEMEEIPPALAGIRTGED
jgi:hypothetical protein